MDAKAVVIQLIPFLGNGPQGASAFMVRFCHPPTRTDPASRNTTDTPPIVHIHAQVELWKLLLSAQETEGGIPRAFLEARAEESRKRAMAELSARRVSQHRGGWGMDTVSEGRSWHQPPPPPPPDRRPHRDRSRSPGPPRGRRDYDDDRHTDHRNRGRDHHALGAGQGLGGRRRRRNRWDESPEGRDRRRASPSYERYDGRDAR